MNHSIKKAKIFKYQICLQACELTFSSNFYSILQISEHDKLALNDFVDLIHPEDKEEVRSSFQTSFVSGDNLCLHFRMVSSSGTIFHVYNETEFSKDSSGKVTNCEGSVHNISDLLATRDRLGELQDLVEMKDHAIAMIAHDLRNPVSQIDGILNLLSDEIEKDYNKDLIALADQSVKHAYQILSELNDATRNKVEGKTIEKVKITVLPLLNSVGDAFKIRLEEKQINLSVQAADDLQVTANENKLFRAIENLISNAIKFSENGKSILLKAWEDEKAICISVNDQGIGMPENICQKLFGGMNKEIRRSGTNGESSIGIGLSIVKGIVDLHQGEIKVNSEVGVGSTFVICLPKY